MFNHTQFSINLLQNPAAFPGKLCLHKNNGDPSANHNPAALHREHCISLRVHPLARVGTCPPQLISAAIPAAALWHVIVPLKSHYLHLCFAQMYCLEGPFSEFGIILNTQNRCCYWLKWKSWKKYKATKCNGKNIKQKIYDKISDLNISGNIFGDLTLIHENTNTHLFLTDSIHTFSLRFPSGLLVMSGSSLLLCNVITVFHLDN